MKCNVCPDGSKMGMNGCDKGNKMKFCFVFLQINRLTLTQTKSVILLSLDGNDENLSEIQYLI